MALIDSNEGRMLNRHDSQEWLNVFCDRPVEMKALRDAYERVSGSSASGPQIVAIVADSGFGKTRLVQEFYNWLSTEKDGVGEAGYWPDHLRRGRSLEINPDVADTNASVPMPFLWWAVRYTDPLRRNGPTYLSQLNTGAEIFVPHLEQMYLERRKGSRGKEGQRIFLDFAVETGMEMLSSIIPGISLLRAGKDAALAYAKLREDRYNDRALDPDEQLNQYRRSLSDDYLRCLGYLFDQEKFGRQTIPFVFLIDDAQWSEDDKPLLNFVENMLLRSRYERWPVLLIVTCWQAEWNQNTSIKPIIERVAGLDWSPVLLDKHPDLSAWVEAAFPGMTPEQVTLVVSKADGNPLLLTEILRNIRANPKYFRGRNVRDALDAEEFARLDMRIFELSKLVGERLSALPEVRETLALSSFQGTRFLTSLSQDLLTSLRRTWTATDSLASAENPHSFVNRLDADSAEFSQRIYHQVALDWLPNVVAESEVRAIIANLIKSRLDALEPGSETLNDLELCRIASDIFERDEKPKRRLLAARALVATMSIAANTSDFLGAYQAAKQLESGILSKRWPIRSFSTSTLFDIMDNLNSYDTPESVTKFISAIVAFCRKAAAKTPTISVRQDLASALGWLGDNHRRKIEFELTEPLYFEALGVRRTIAGEAPGRETLNDLLVAITRQVEFIKRRDRMLMARAESEEEYYRAVFRQYKTNRELQTLNDEAAELRKRLSLLRK